MSEREIEKAAAKTPIWETAPDRTNEAGARLCVIPLCDRTILSKRLCSPHYQAVRRGTINPETGVMDSERAPDPKEEKGYPKTFGGYDKYVYLLTTGELVNKETRRRWYVHNAVQVWGKRLRRDLENSKFETYEAEVWRPEPNAMVPSTDWNSYVPLETLKSTGFELLHSNMETLLSNLAGDDVEWFKDWLAYKIQHPYECHGAVVIHGVQRAGKGTLEVVLKSIFNPYFSSIDSLALASEFNGWAMKKFFVVADEVNVSNMRDRELVKKLLKKYTAPNELLINQKNVPTFNQKNHASWLIFSNDNTVVDIEESDRRFSVFKVNTPISHILGKEIAKNAAMYGQNLVNALANRELKHYKEGDPLDNQARKTMQARAHEVLRLAK